MLRLHCIIVKRACNADWSRWLSEILDTDVNIRDKLLGIEYVKQQILPKLYERADMHGELAGFKQHAEAAEDYLEKRQ